MFSILFELELNSQFFVYSVRAKLKQEKKEFFIAFLQTRLQPEHKQINTSTNENLPVCSINYVSILPSVMNYQ